MRDTPPASNHPKRLIFFVGYKAFVAVVVLAITLSLRKRDFLKVFVSVLLVPVLIEAGMDVIRQIYEHSPFYGHSGNDFFILTLFAARDYIFWSSLFTSVVAFYFSIRAITKPVNTSNTDYLPFFLKAQIIPVIFTVFDSITTAVEVPSMVLGSGVFLWSLTTVMVSIVLFAQAVLSLIALFFRRDEFATSSPQDQIRNSKWRLFWFIIFQIVIQAMNVHFMFICGLAVIGRFVNLFELSFEPSETDVDNDFTIDSYLDHHILLLTFRPFILSIAILFFLVPYRRKMVESCCPCCFRTEATESIDDSL